MKKIIMFFVMFVMMSVTTFAFDRIITVQELPAKAQTFIKTYFPTQTVMYAKIDRDIRITYEVRLNDGTEIEFNSNGVWDKVDCKHLPVPSKLIPVAISDYVKTHYPNIQIVKIDKERRGYDIELSNDLDLSFNKRFQLIDIDD